MILRLEKVRSDKNITQKELSIMSGLSKSYISELESGKYSSTIKVICKLCKALGCTPNDLVKCEGEDAENE
jgi:putative transcriptional regulator